MLLVFDCEGEEARLRSNRISCLDCLLAFGNHDLKARMVLFESLLGQIDGCLGHWVYRLIPIIVRFFLVTARFPIARLRVGIEARISGALQTRTDFKSHTSCTIHSTLTTPSLLVSSAPLSDNAHPACDPLTPPRRLFLSWLPSSQNPPVTVWLDPAPGHIILLDRGW